MQQYKMANNIASWRDVYFALLWKRQNIGLGTSVKNINYYYYTSCMTSLFLLKLLTFVRLITELAMPKEFRVLSTHTHTHNRFTAGLEYVRVHPGQQVPER